MRKGVDQTPAATATRTWTQAWQWPQDVECHSIRSSNGGWNDLPKEPGDDSTVHRRLKQWHHDGTFDRSLRAFLSTLDQQGKLDWAETFLNGTFNPYEGGSKVVYGPKGKGRAWHQVTDGKVSLGRTSLLSWRCQAMGHLRRNATLLLDSIPRTTSRYPCSAARSFPV